MTAGGLGGVRELAGRGPAALHGNHLLIPPDRASLLPWTDPDGSGTS